MNSGNNEKKYVNIAPGSQKVMAFPLSSVILASSSYPVVANPMLVTPASAGAAKEATTQVSMASQSHNTPSQPSLLIPVPSDASSVPVLLPSGSVSGYPPNATLVSKAPNITPSFFTKTLRNDISPGSSSLLKHNLHTMQNQSLGTVFSKAPQTNLHYMPYDHENENSNLGPEDFDEVRQMTKAAAAVSVQENIWKNDAGKCLNGGELRLSELEEKLNNYTLPEGFRLVGAKSPMLPGITLVAVVDKRYLPGDPNTITMLGFSGNCIGCGATGFRYFTEFSTHINLKLATQPKKQKHLKYYISQNSDGKWCRGPLIPWKGTETRKRSVPSYSMPLYGRAPQVMPSITREMLRRKEQPPLYVSAAESSSEPDVKRIKPIIETELQPADSSSNAEITAVASSSHLSDSENLPSSIKFPISNICGVKPILLLCQQKSWKPHFKSHGIIITDLLVECFDSLESRPPSNPPPNVNLTPNTIMSTGFNTLPTNEGVKSDSDSITSVEQNAATMLINMSGNSSEAHSSLAASSEFSENRIGSRRDQQKVLSRETALILLTQYLCSLDDLSISKEDIEFVMNKSRRELASAKSTSSNLGNNLTFIMNILCSTSSGNVKSIFSSHSLQNSVYKALQWLQDTFYLSNMSNKKLKLPDFIVLASTPKFGSIEFAILVTGVSHAKILAECLGFNSITHCPFEENWQRLNKQFQQTTEALEHLMKLSNEARDDLVYIPFNGYAGIRLPKEEAESYHPSVAPISATPTHTEGIFANQVAMAHELLSQLRNIGENPEIIDLTSFHKVEILIVVPPTLSLYYLTVKRLCQSGLLNYLGLEAETPICDHSVGQKYVITYSDCPQSMNRWNNFVKNALEDKEMLSLLIFDQAQQYSFPQGMPDVFPNLKEVFESTNVVCVFVTSVPYIFQTKRSFIDPDNEVYWTDARQWKGKELVSSKYGDDKHAIISDKDMIYFGVKDYCESTRWYQQYALIRHEETFDVTLPKANNLNDVSYSLVQGYSLLRLYQAALLVAGGIKPAEQYVVMSIIRMINDIVESPLRNADGSGCMLMIRLPNKRLGKYFHKVLTETRNSIGFQYRFDIIYDDGENELEIGSHFLERMRHWRLKTGWKEDLVKSWKPRCLEELLDLPSILILSGEGRSGETLPRSLKYADFNILNHSCFNRSTIEAEIGAVSCYLSLNASSHSDIARKPVVMNNVRTCVGTTYLSSTKLRRRAKNFGLLQGTCASPAHTGKCEACLSKGHGKNHVDTITHFTSKYPLPILLVSKPLWKLLQMDTGSGPGLINLNSDPHTRWLVSDRPLLTTMKPAHVSRHYRRLTDARRCRKLKSSSTPHSPAAVPSEEIESYASESNKLLQVGRNTHEEGSRILSEQIDHDDKDSDYSNKEQYHPRCLLFTGPPQAGKTGAYLYFARLLHRMLMRLKRVDVFDNCITYQPVSISNQVPSANTVLGTEFLQQFADTVLDKMSKVHVVSDGNGISQTVNCHVEVGSDSALVILSKTSCFDTLHHCDICKFYREGIGNLNMDLYTYDFVHENQNTQLMFSIPPIHLKYFEINENGKVISSIKLSKYGENDLCKKNVCYDQQVAKTPIFMYSCSGEEEGLFNLFHAMEETDHLHITFIRNGSLRKYQKHWPNHIFVELPISFNNASDSSVRELVKCFASAIYNSEVERCEDEVKVWPFVLMMPDNLVMWQTCARKEEEADSDSDDDDRSVQKNNPNLPESVMSPCKTRRENSSLLEFMSVIEQEEKFLDFGIIGIRAWSSYQEEISMPFFLRTFVHSCLFINLKLMQQCKFSKHLYSGDEIDLQLQMLRLKIPFCRLELFSYMTKITTAGSWRSPEYSNDNTTLLADVTSIDTLIVPPDVVSSNLISASADLIMQRYMCLAGTNLFPKGKDGHPVVVFGSYLDIGSNLKICVVSDNTDQVKNMTFSGMIIYNNSKDLTPELLSELKFLKNSSVILICEERYNLRSELQRLELEDKWRFRLRDEYQTATITNEESRPLYFLIGSYIFN